MRKLINWCKLNVDVVFACTLAFVLTLLLGFSAGNAVVLIALSLAGVTCLWLIGGYVNRRNK